MILINTYLDDDVLRDIAYIENIWNGDISNAATSTTRNMRKLFELGIQNVLNGPAVREILDKLRREPIPVIYGQDGHLRWKSERQKNKVLMMLRLQKNMPYRRTHILSRGWTVMKAADVVQSGPLRGYIRFFNADKQGIYDWVQGDWIQPFHKDTGWPDASEIIGRNSDKVQEEVITAWLLSQALLGRFEDYSHNLKAMTKGTRWQILSGKAGSGNATIGSGGAPGFSQGYKGFQRFVNERKSVT